MNTHFAIVREWHYEPISEDTIMVRCDAFPERNIDAAKSTLIERFGDRADWDCEGIKVSVDINTSELVTVEYRHQFLNTSNPKHGKLFLVETFMVSDKYPF